MRLKLRKLSPEDEARRAEWSEKRQLCREWNESHADGRIALPVPCPHVVLTMYPYPYGHVHVTVLQSYEIRDALKTRGYRYGDQVWEKLFETIEAAIDEAEALHSDLGVQLGDGVVS